MQHTSARQSSTSYQGNEPQESSVSTTVMIEGPSYGFGNRKFRPQIPRSNKTLRSEVSPGTRREPEMLRIRNAHSTIPGEDRGPCNIRRRDSPLHRIRGTSRKKVA